MTTKEKNYFVVIDNRPSVSDDVNIYVFKSKEEALERYNEEWLETHSFSLDDILEVVKDGTKYIGTF